jgi:GNAT superfamily N-acetyltransferase
MLSVWLQIQHFFMPLTFLTTESPTTEEMAAVDKGLAEFNAHQPELAQVRSLCVLVKDRDDRVVAGAIGRTWGQCSEIQQLWVDESFRHKGIGRGALKRFENEAYARGCKLVYLDTFTFQAPGFYEKHGYSPVLITSGYAEGVEKLTMHKSLVHRTEV